MTIIMKKIYYALLLPFAMVTTSKAQSTLDFEPSGNGADISWNVFENGTNPALEFVANPNSAGINTSANAAKYTTLLEGQPWAGCETQNDAIAPWTLSASNCIIKIMVYKDVISDVAIKLTQVGDAALPEIKVANTVINQWEELTFDFSGQVPNTAAQIKNLVIFPDFPAGGPDSRTYASVTYFDNITFTSGDVEIPEEPMEAAPVPTAAAENVISLFSNTYTNIPIENWITSWSSGSKQDIVIEGNDTMKYLGLGFAGVDIGVANQVNASEMTHFNVDVWLPEDNDMVFAVKLVDFGANGVWNGGGDDTEAQVAFPDLAPGQWHSLSIPLGDFTAMTGNEHISQLLFVNAFEGGGSAIAYVDNIYFSNGDVVEPAEPMTAAPDPTMPEAQVISMYSGVYANVPVDTWHTVWSDSAYEEVQIAGNPTIKFSNLNFTGIEMLGANSLDITGMTHFNMHVWSPNFPVFKVKLVDFGADNAFSGGDDTEHELVFDAPTQGEWITYSIPLTDFTGVLNKEHVSQLIFATSDSASTVYIDNIYFSTATAGIEDFVDAKPVLYPNPASTTINLKGLSVISSVEVFNALGQKVITTTPNSDELQLNVSGLQSGLYIMNTIADGKMTTQKFIKQ